MAQLQAYAFYTLAASPGQQKSQTVFQQQYQKQEGLFNGPESGYFSDNFFVGSPGRSYYLTYTFATLQEWLLEPSMDSLRGFCKDHLKVRSLQDTLTLEYA